MPRSGKKKNQGEGDETQEIPREHNESLERSFTNLGVYGGASFAETVKAKNPERTVDDVELDEGSLQMLKTVQLMNADMVSKLLQVQERRAPPSLRKMGEDCDVMTYMEEFEAHMQARDIDEKDWTKHLRPLLNEVARTAIGTLEVHDRHDYEQVKDVLLEQDPQTTTSAAYAWWTASLKHGQTLQQYGMELKKLAARIPGYNIADVKDSFCAEKLLQFLPAWRQTQT